MVDITHISIASTTAADNLASRGISYAEGWLPSTVNNAGRADWSILSGWYDDWGAVNTVAGTANAVTVTGTITATALARGMRLLFIPASSNTTAATLNLDAIGAKAIRKIEGGTDVALEASDILAGVYADVIYSATANAAAGAWILQNPQARIPASTAGKILTASGVGNKASASGIKVAFAPAAPGIDVYTLTFDYTDAAVASQTVNGIYINISDTGVTTLGLTSGQIEFPASPVNATGVNVLDAFENNTYTPTLFNTTNVDSTTAAVCNYVRSGDKVTVSGEFTADLTTAAGTPTTIGMSLPIASALTGNSQLGGTGSGVGFNETWSIRADAGNDRATFQCAAQTAASHVITFSFTYTVL